MSPVVLEIVFIIMLILANSVFAMSEAAVISARKARLQQRVNEGDIKARRALELAEEPSDFLATVQIGITLVGILAGAFGGATIAEQLADILETVPFLSSASRAVSLGLVVLAITYLSLVMGELVPKNLALNRAEDIASAIAQPMSALSKLVAPMVYLLNASTSVVLKILGTESSSELAVTEEEIKVLIDQGTVAGTFQGPERDMLARVFRFADRRVSTLMTPRSEIAWLDLNVTPEVLRSRIITSQHSRFPVAEGDLDHVRGIVRTADLLSQQLRGQPLDLQANLKAVLFVPGTAMALEVLETFKQTGHHHMALVVDEYGGIQGLVTLTNLLEELVGDVAISEGRIEPQVVQRQDGSWLLDGMLPIQRLKDILTLKELPEEERSYQTLGGFVMAHLGRIPTSGDAFEVYGQRFEVVDMDGYRVDKVLVVPVSTEPPVLVQDERE
jgi:putative hemolysin